MGKNKKKSEPTMSKPELSKRLLALMSNHPGESYNYKQLAMRLQVKSMGMKRQISEVLRELGEKGELEEISTGRYKMRQASRRMKGASSCENQTIKVKSAFFFARFFVSSACLDVQRPCSL